MKPHTMQVGSAAIGAVLALSLTCSFASAQEPALQADWIQSPINGNWYGVDYTTRRWTESEALAVSLGGHLATVRSQAEQDWIGQSFASFQSFGAVWIGLVQDAGALEPDGGWGWVSGEVLTYTNWNSGEPNDTGGLEDVAGQIFTSGFGWNDGNGNNGIHPPLIELPTEPQVGWSWPTRTASVSGPYWGCLADLDGDQDLDYVVPHHGQGTPGSALAVFLNDGAGGFSAGPVIPLGFSRPHDVKAIDHDQDGAPDLVVTVYQDGRLLLVENEGGLVFTTNPTPLLTGGLFHNLIAMHVNGDGLLDLAVSRLNTDSILLGLGQPGGGFSFGAEVPVGQSPRFLASGDLNGDMIADVVVSCRDAQVLEVYQNDGAGLLTSMAVVPVLSPADMTVGDLDGDGDLDIWSLSEQGQAYIWANDGIGNFTAMGAPVSCGSHPFKSAVGDFDADGDLDVVVGSRGDSALIVLSNDGTGAYPQSSLLSNHSDPFDVLVGDLDGNGSLDVLGSDFNSDAFVVHLNQMLSDCNGNGVPDSDDIAAGASLDCNANGVPDSCDIDLGISQDCNANGTPDDCDLGSGNSQDCDGNQMPDECDIASGANLDCNMNGIPDVCDITAGTSQDCNMNGIPDECEPDCNSNSVPDDCDLASGASVDLNDNGVPDECKPDCDGDGLPDFIELIYGTQLDCNANGIPDDCEAPGTNYCVAAPNSVSPTGATIWASGSSNVVGNDLVLMAGPVPVNEFGVFFHAAAQVQIPFGEGVQCAAAGLVRVWPATPADGAGTITKNVNLTGPDGTWIAPGVTRNFQCWYRDPAGGPNGHNLSDGLAVCFY